MEEEEQEEAMHPSKRSNTATKEATGAPSLSDYAAVDCLHGVRVAGCVAIADRDGRVLVLLRLLLLRRRRRILLRRRVVIAADRGAAVSLG
jgi:hypothetical protein